MQRPDSFCLFARQFQSGWSVLQYGSFERQKQPVICQLSSGQFLSNSRRSLDSLGSLDIPAWGLASKTGEAPAFGPNAT